MTRTSPLNAGLVSVQPFPIDLGVVYQGTTVEGSFFVADATEVLSIETVEGSDFVELLAPKPTKQGLIWTFRLHQLPVGQLRQLVAIETDGGTGYQQFAAEVRKGQAPGGAIVFCSSPYSAFTSEHTISSLKLMIRQLQVQVQASDQLPTDLSPFDVVVLREVGLRSLVDGQIKTIQNALERGVRVVVLADAFMIDSIMLANHLIEPWGLRFEQTEYREVMCDARHITTHIATHGVSQLFWFRPSPITVHGSAEVLVRNPTQPQEGFVACSGPHRNLFALGSSLLSSFICVGWPFHNGQLFANMLSTQHGQTSRP